MKKIILLLSLFNLTLFAQDSVKQITNFNFDVTNPVVSQSDNMFYSCPGYLIFETHNGDSSNIAAMRYWNVTDDFEPLQYITRDGYINKNPFSYNYYNTSAVIWETNRNGNFDIAYRLIDCNGDFGEVHIATNTPENEEEVSPVKNQGDFNSIAIKVIFKRGDKTLIKDILDNTAAEDTVFTDSAGITFSQPVASYAYYYWAPLLAAAVRDSAGIKKLVYKVKSNNVWGDIQTINFNGIPDNPSFDFDGNLFCEYQDSSQKSIYHFRLTPADAVVDTVFSDSSASYSNLHEVFLQIPTQKDNWLFFPYILEKKEGDQTYIITSNLYDCNDADTTVRVSVSDPQPNIGIVEYGGCFLPLYAVWIDSANGHKNIFAYKSHIIQGSTENESGKVNGFKLYQNYPNPFNPTTTIKYSIPSVSRRNFPYGHNDIANITLKVYDVLGREVATLVNKRQAPGNYTVNFNASKLTSGIYFYRLQSGRTSITKKLVLLR